MKHKRKKKEYDDISIDDDDYEDEIEKEYEDEKSLTATEYKEEFPEDFDDSYDDIGAGAGGPPPLEKHNDLLKELTNFKPFIRQMMNGWMGISWNEAEAKFTRDPNITPVMNIQGASWCTDRLKSYARENNIITNIGKEEYVNIISDLVYDVWLNLCDRTEEFGIRKDGDLLRIGNELLHSTELVLMGAGDGKYNQFLSTTITRHESINATPQIQGQPVMGALPQKRAGLLGKMKSAIFGG